MRWYEFDTTRNWINLEIVQFSLFEDGCYELEQADDWKSAAFDYLVLRATNGKAA